MRGKVLVEVGCGRGGCFRFVVSEYKPHKAIGIDLSQENVNFCLQSFAENPIQTSEIAFMQGNSMTLDRNLRPQSTDFLINVESSHCYPRLEDFFKSVCHVLKDDGIFFYADFRFSGSDFQRV